jgi:hypothetical protein
VVGWSMSVKKHPRVTPPPHIGSIT